MKIIIQTLVASPVTKIVMAITPLARKHINFRPLVSARLPQKGETKACEMKVIAKARPEKRFNWKWVKVPNSLINKEIKGIVIE